MSLSRRLLALFFAAWLPFSAVAASLMPLCVHENATQQMQTAHDAEPGCEHHDGCPDVAGADDDGSRTGECAQCGLCVFSATLWLPGAQSAIHAASSSAVIDGDFPALVSHVFPPADRPPLASA